MANFVISAFLSYLLYVTFESPFIAMEKMLCIKAPVSSTSSKVATAKTMAYPSGPKVAYTNTKIVELIGPMIDTKRTSRLLDRVIDGNQVHLQCQGCRGSKKTWDNSVHSKSFVYVERL